MESNVFVGVKFGSTATSKVGPGDPSGSNNSKKLPNNYDYILMPVTNGRYKDTVRTYFQNFNYNQNNKDVMVDEMVLEVPEPELQDLCIPPFNVNQKKDGPSYIGLLSSWLELESCDSFIREMCYQVLLNECKYARFVGMSKLILAPPRELSDLQMYSQVVSRLLNHDVVCSSPPILLSISLPLYEDSDPLATWELWHTIRKLCGYHSSLSISLAVPRIKTPSHVLNRWLCEPVSCLLISSSIFATNRYNYPVLQKFNQYLITKFQRINGNSQPNNNSDLCIILHGMEKYSNTIKGGESAYLEYINYLLKKGDKFMSSFDTTPVDQFCLKQPKLDVYTPRLMAPLKPHAETLTNYVYSVFERDIIKYDIYQNAIQKALVDLLAFAKSQPLVVLIAGAGRGPLVERTIRILKQLNVIDKVKLIAIERNKQACLYLQKRNFDSWNNWVTIIKEDMRQWKDESIKIDLCISELLGSFGCNELSPECLYTVEKYHAKPNTIFIPKSYTSYIAPISSPLLHQKIGLTENGKESAWVMHNIPYCILSSKINELWTFEHPIRKTDSQVSIFQRNMVTEFRIKYRGEIHGLIGFFTAKLYDDVELSTLPDESIVKLLPDLATDKQRLRNSNFLSHPNDYQMAAASNKSLLGEKFKKYNHTPNMNSWSPMVFPLKEPFAVTDDTELSVFISRNYSLQRHSVWYEWSVESFVYLVLSGTPLQKSVHATQIPQPINANRTPTNTNRQPTGSSAFSPEGEGAAFSDMVPENAFLPNQESGWQSVNDIHGLTTGEEKPMFDLGMDEFESEEEEVHVRVKTGVSALHNIDGRSFCLRLSS